MDSGRAFAACALLGALLAAVAAIKIDSHISASTSDCYERVALGRRVAPEEVLRAVAVSSLKQCERECNLALDRCGAFSFGIGAKGNGSCELSAPATRRLPLREDPDWDTWRKRAECRVRPPPDYATATHDHPHGAPPDSGSSETPSYSHGDDHGNGHHSHKPGHDSYAPPQDSYRPPQDSYGTPEDSYGPPKDSYGPPKDSYGPPKDSYGPPKDSYGPPKDSYVPPKDSYGPPKDSYGPPQDSYGPPQDSYGPPQDPYGPTGHDFYSPSHDHSPGFPGNHYGPPHACFRLLATGRRVSERLVRSSLPAAALTACLEACERERRFSCEALNFRAPDGGRGGACELLSTPVEHLRPAADLVPEAAFAVYRRDRDGPPGCDPNELRAPPRGGPWAGPPGGPGGPGYGPAGPGGQGQRPPAPNRGYGNGWSYGGGNGWSYGGGGGWDRDGGPGNGGGWSAERPWRPPGPAPGPAPGPWAEDPRPPVQGHDEECFVRWRAGFRLERSLVAAAVAAATLPECRAACAAERRFPCGAFSLRYSAAPADPCLLTEASAASRMRPYNDLLPDRDYDVFLLLPVSRAAREDLHCLPPAPASPPAHGHHTPGSECFRRLRSGLRLARATVRDSALAGSLAECELLCLRARFFLCRAFSFRFGPGPQEGGPGGPSGGPLDSCLLSDWPATELAAEGPRALAEDPSAELYERGSYGLGCEIDGPPTAPPHDHGAGAGTAVAGAPGPAEEVCYAPLWEPAALLGHAVRSSLAVHTEAECRAECSRVRRAFLFFCSAVSFRSESNWAEEPEEQDAPPHHNCLLSDIEQRDLRPGQDYARRPGHRLAAWNPAADPRCHLAEEAGAAGGAGSPSHEHHAGPGHDHGPPGHGPPGHGPPGHGAPGHGAPGHGAPAFPFPERDAGSTWRYFTVGGRPCRRGTQCAQEPLGGFWGCEVEGGDHGQWDYCCRPDHRCGFSEGYDYPWCYVGSAGPEQWRPCSDHYFPYQNSGGIGPQGGPQGPGSGGPWSGGGGGGGGGGSTPWNRPYNGGSGPWSGGGGGGGGGVGGGSGPWGSGPWNGGSGGPGHWSGGSANGWQAGGWAAGGGRRWPVAYLHRELPPNATAHAHGHGRPGAGPGASGPSGPPRAPLGLDVGFDNYVDAYRSGYGKKLEDRNTTAHALGGVSGGGSGGGRRGWGHSAAAKPRYPADRQFVLGVSLTSGGASTKDGPPPTSPLTTLTPPSTVVATHPPPPPPPPPISFEVVDQPDDEDEDDSSSLTSSHAPRVTSSDSDDDSSSGPASTEAPNLSKLQPRLAAGSRRGAWQRVSSSSDRPRPRTRTPNTTPAFQLRRRGSRPLADFFSRETRQ